RGRGGADPPRCRPGARPRDRPAHPAGGRAGDPFPRSAAGGRHHRRRGRPRVAQLACDITAAAVVDPTTSSWREGFAASYAALRAHKGMTAEVAFDRVVDPSYFGTMMVHAGLADGMVSGCVTTTAHTIRPALEVVRTAP